MSRIDTIVERVLDIVSDAGGRKMRPGRVLQELQQIQRDVARRTQCIEREDTIELRLDTATYVIPGGIYKITLILPPSDWTNTIQVVQNEKEWLKIIRDTSITGLPKFAFVWHDKFRIHPAAGAEQAGDEITLWNYGGPTKKPVEGGNPETPEEYDDALTFGTAATILAILKNSQPNINNGNWGSMYTGELSTRRAEGLQRKTTEPIKRDSSSSDLHF